jgi:CBS domain-containing protein
MRIGDLMRTDVPVAAPEDSVLLAANRMVQAGVRAIPVCAGDAIAGIITDWDLTRAIASGSVATARTVADFMTAEVVCASADMQLSDAGQLMGEHRIHHLVVTHEGRFAGILHLDVEWSGLGGLGAPHATFAAPS